jgi:dethiobiotin synthetase
MAAPRARDLAAAVRAIIPPAHIALVEGAGGLLVPLNETEDLADLAAALAFPLVVVAADQLGVLSSVLSCLEAARARALTVRAVVLSSRAPDARDPSPRTNRAILERRLQLPVGVMPFCEYDDDDALADAVERAGLIELLAETPVQLG